MKDKKWSVMNVGNISTVKNAGGKTLSYCTSSGVKILTEDGFAFKDLNKNGKLDPMKTGACPPGRGQRTWRKGCP